MPNHCSANSNRHSLGAAEGQVGLLEQHLRWEVLYNQLVLHVGA